MPEPGVTFMLASIWACWVWPAALSAATACSWVTPGRDLLADDPVEDDVRGVAEDLRPDDGERHADDRERDDEEDPGQLGAERPDQAAERALEVLGLLGGQPDTTERPSRPGAGGGRRPAGPGHHAASSVLSCE